MRFNRFSPTHVAVAFVWLALAYSLQSFPLGRRCMAYGGSLVAMVHVCSAFFIFVSMWASKKHAGSVIPDLGPLVIGVILGVVIGFWTGRIAAQNALVYWTAQAVAISFLICLPLVPW